MAWIRHVPEPDIPPESRVEDRDHILRIHGVHPEVMRLHYDLYLEVMKRPSPLSRRQREMIAVAVSAANRCHY
jgi:alkylhydroperoxidase/carboxymuconolactone decarboxylase family protein YurZ